MTGCGRKVGYIRKVLNEALPDGSLTLQSGSLTLNGSTLLPAGVALNLNGGTLSNNGTLDIGGTFDLAGGSFAGTGSLTSGWSFASNLTTSGQVRLSMVSPGGGVSGAGEGDGGVAAARGGRIVWRHVETARLTMRTMDARFIADYLDQAGPDVYASVGAYHLEGLGPHLMSRIEGDFYSILGLPLLAVLDFLRTQGALRA